MFAGDGGVVALVDGRQDVAILLAVVVNGLDVFGMVVREAEAGEVALLVDFVDTGEGGGEWDARVRGVDVEDVDL